MSIDKIERRALWITATANLVMAIAAWLIFKLTNSQAILLDGNFSFVLAIATVIAIYISKNKHKKTTTFPYGSYVYEAAFILSKGLLILGIVVVAFFQNAIKIIEFIQGEKTEPIVLIPIYYYTIFILILTGLLLLFFKRQNKKVKNKSGLLLVEAESAKIDGILTSAMGLAFFIISLIIVGSFFEFLIYIGDSIIVIIISLAMVGSPVKIIKNAFIELSGGTLKNQKEKQEIEESIQEVICDMFSFSTFISKVGSGYLVVVYVEPENNDCGIKEFRLVQHGVKQKLKENFDTIFVEIALKD